MTAFLTLAAVLLDAALGEPRRWHPLVGFGRWAQYLERVLNPEASRPEASRAEAGDPEVGNLEAGRPEAFHPEAFHPEAFHPEAGSLEAGNPEVGNPEVGNPEVGNPEVGNLQKATHREAAHVPCELRLRGVVAVLLTVMPWILLVSVLTGGTLGFATGSGSRYFGYVVSVATLYFALGHQSLREHALRVHDALEEGDLAEARAKVGFMVSRDTGRMDGQAVASAAVESVLENGNDAVFGAVFWFLLGGAPGVLLYRLANTLDAMWGYRTPRYLYFGWAAARLDDALNFIPARLTALTYALIGHTRSALRCWRLQAGAWESPNAGPVMAAGAGALGVGLGGGAFYHGQWEERPALGEGPRPDAASIPAALRLVRLGLIVWLCAVIAVEGAAYA